MSVASWESDNLIMFQFRVSSSQRTNVLWFAPGFFLCLSMCLSASLQPSHFPSPSPEGDELSRMFAFSVLSLGNWGLEKGAMLLAQSKGPGFWEHLVLAMLGPDSWLLQFVMQCRGAFAVMVRYLVWVTDLKVTFDEVSQKIPLFYIFIFIACYIFRHGKTVVHICSMNYCVYRDAEYPLVHQCLWATTWSKHWSK